MDARTLDLKSLVPILESGPRPLFATVSGAHLYGFASKDSDVDIRGAYIRPLDEVLGLGPHQETWEVSDVREDGLEVDWVAHDVFKFVNLMTKRNGYVLEQLYSPLVVHGDEWLRELRHLGKACIVRQLHYHYRGFFHNQLKIMDKGEPTAKAILYAYRVLLTGIHLLGTGRVEAHLGHLLEDHPTAGVEELMELKIAGGEKDKLEPSMVESHRHALLELDEALNDARTQSELPERLEDRRALSDFVVRARRALGD